MEAFHKGCSTAQPSFENSGRALLSYFSYYIMHAARPSGASATPRFNNLWLVLRSFLKKGDNKRVVASGGDRMARPAPNPGVGASVELSGRDACDLLNFISIRKTPSY